MEKSGVTLTEEGKASEKQRQVNVDLFLGSEGKCSQRICHPGQTVNAAFYIESFETSTGECAKEAN